MQEPGEERGIRPQSPAWSVPPRPSGAVQKNNRASTAYTLPPARRAPRSAHSNKCKMTSRQRVSTPTEMRSLKQREGIGGRLLACVPPQQERWSRHGEWKWQPATAHARAAANRTEHNKEPSARILAERQRRMRAWCPRTRQCRNACSRRFRWRGEVPSTSGRHGRVAPVACACVVCRSRMHRIKALRRPAATRRRGERTTSRR